jgi:hypothetical protein
MRRGLLAVALLIAGAALLSSGAVVASAHQGAMTAQASQPWPDVDGLAVAENSGGPFGPCSDATIDAMPVGGGHDHKNINQHRFRCRMQQVAFLSLTEQLRGQPDAVLGEMDVKADIAAVAVAYPESGALFFDVSDPANPKFLSWYRGSECEQVIIDIDCGAFIDLSNDGKQAFLSVQSLSVVPGAPTDPATRPVSEPGVEVIDIANPRSPQLVQALPVQSLGGVHTSRSHVVPQGPSASGQPRAPGEYLFSVANVEAVQVSRVSSSGPARLVPINRIPVDELHDMFLQNDPLTGRTYLYVVGGFSSGFYVFDVTDPANETFLGEWDITPECPDDWYAHTIDVTVVGGRRWVTMPAELFDGGAQSSAERQRGCGDREGNPGRAGPIWIVDATDFSRLARENDSDAEIKRKSQETLHVTWTNPLGRTGGNLLFTPHNQQIVGNKMYLSSYHAGVWVLDASAAFAGRRERPTEQAFIVPSGSETRPIAGAGVGQAGPLIRFFTGFPLSRPHVWDMFFYKGYVLAADMTGGFYSLREDDSPAPAAEQPPGVAGPPGRRFLISKRLRRPNRRGVVRIGARCVSIVPCRGVLRLRARVRRGSAGAARRTITVGRVRFAVEAGQRARLPVRLRARDRRRLRRARRVRAIAHARLSADAVGNPPTRVMQAFPLARRRR